MSDLFKNLGDLTKPAEILIAKISDAVGGVFSPWQTKRVAKAEAEANLIKAKSEADVDLIKAKSEIEIRAIHRYFEEETKKQGNMENIIYKATLALNETSDPSKLDDDWLTNFFDKCRIVSDDKMQSLWAKILSGESNNPGKFSKRTVAFVATLDKDDADIFTKLCSFGWMIGNTFKPLIFDEQEDIYNRQGINFNGLNHLHSIGLINFGPLAGFRNIGLPKQYQVFYDRQLLTLDFGKDSNNTLDIGRVMLTKTGQELASICDRKTVDGFLDYVKDKWKSYLMDQ